MDFYGIDMGGTNLRISRVDPQTGALLGVPGNGQGTASAAKVDGATYPMREITTNRELTRIVFSHIPRGSHVGISAAGDVDEENLVIRLSANSPIRGEILIGRQLRDKRDCVVYETNDMNAAVQAIARYGQGREHENVLLATYSSGFNCALTRKGRNVTIAEFGHMVYKPDGDLYCGCGGKGHLESYVSGNGAVAMARQYLRIGHVANHPILDSSLADLNRSLPAEKRLTRKSLKDPVIYARVLDGVSAKHVYTAYARHPKSQPQRDIRETQIAAIADSFGKMNSAYHPLDIIVLMGSQTIDWQTLFEPAIKLYRSGNRGFQIPSFPKPPIVRAAVKEIGIVGAVAYFLSRIS